jgi:hypothetical protein
VAPGAPVAPVAPGAHIPPNGVASPNGHYASNGHAGSDGRTAGNGQHPGGIPHPGGSPHPGSPYTGEQPTGTQFPAHSPYGAGGQPASPAPDSPPTEQFPSLSHLPPVAPPPSVAAVQRWACFGAVGPVWVGRIPAWQLQPAEPPPPARLQSLPRRPQLIRTLAPDGDRPAAGPAAAGPVWPAITGDRAGSRSTSLARAALRLACLSAIAQWRLNCFRARPVLSR